MDTTKIKNTNNLGAYTLKDYKVKMIDRIQKCLTLTARNKPDLIENITGYANYDLCEGERPSYITTESTSDWFFEQVDEKWDLELWKPIRVEERLEVFGTPGLGKIAYKHKFWLKKIVVKFNYIPCSLFGEVMEEEPPRWELYHSFAVCYDKSKNGEYTIINDELNTGIIVSSEWEHYKEGTYHKEKWNELHHLSRFNKYIELDY